MKKVILSTILSIAMLFSGISGLAFTKWESPRYVPDDEKNGYLKTEEGNPYVTYYAPWLRQLHLMTATEAANNKEAGIVGGEACQQIRQLAISPKNPNIMYLCSNTSGVYKTTDGGEHWYNVTNNAAGHDARGLLCDKFDENTVYVYMTKVGVHRSEDGGYTWEQIVEDKDEKQNKGFRSDTIVQDNDGNTYMAVGSGIWKLARGAKEAVNLTEKLPVASLTGEDTAEFLDMAVSPDGKYIYACCTWAPAAAVETGVKTGLYISTDGGSTWEIRQSASDGSTYSDIRTIALDPDDLTYQTIYAGLRITKTEESTTGEYKLYKLENGGEKYTEVFRPKNLEGNNIYFYGLKFGPETEDGDYPLYLHLHKTNYPLRVSCDYRTETPADFSPVYQKSHGMGNGTIREGYTGNLYQAFQPDMEKKGTNEIRIIYSASGIYDYTGTYDSTNKTIAKSDIKRISSGYSGASATDIAFDSQGRMFMTVTDIGTYVNDGSAYTKDPDTGEISYPTFLHQNKNVKHKYGVRAIFDPENDSHVIMYVGYTNGSGTYCGIKQSYDGGITFNTFNTDAKLLYRKPAEDTDDDSGEGNTEEDTDVDSGEDDAEEDLGNSEGESSDSDSGTTTTLPWANYGNAKVLCYDNDDVDKNGKKSTIYSSYHNSYNNGETWTANDYFILDVYPKDTKIQVGRIMSGADTIIYQTVDGGKNWEKKVDLKVGGFTDVDFDPNNPDYLWITRNVSGGSMAFVRVNLKDKTYKDYTGKFKNNINDIDYYAFRQVEINPKNSNHMLVTSYPGRQHDNMKNDFKLAESYDGGQSWHTVPGLWGQDFNNIIFSPTTDEVFITGHAGTFIYDYKKFNYYQAVNLDYDGSVVKTTLPRVNEVGGGKANNGSFIVAPGDILNPTNKVLTGWVYNGTTYKPGDLIPVPQ